MTLRPSARPSGGARRTFPSGSRGLALRRPTHLIRRAHAAPTPIYHACDRHNCVNKQVADTFREFLRPRAASYTQRSSAYAAVRSRGDPLQDVGVRDGGVRGGCALTAVIFSATFRKSFGFSNQCLAENCNYNSTLNYFQHFILVAKFSFDTAEKDPFKICKRLEKYPFQPSVRGSRRMVDVCFR